MPGCEGRGTCPGRTGAVPGGSRSSGCRWGVAGTGASGALGAAYPSIRRSREESVMAER